MLDFWAGRLQKLLDFIGWHCESAALMRAVGTLCAGRVRKGARLSKQATPAEILGEIEELLRIYPPETAFLDRTNECDEWCGRAAAALSMQADLQKERAEFDLALQEVGGSDHGGGYKLLLTGRQRMRRLLHQVRFKIRNDSVGPVAVAVGTGEVFDYFDQVRQVIEAAGSDLLFIDPYLDADFVARYLPHVKPSVKVRLLGQKNTAALAAAAGLFTSQHAVPIEVRQASDLHDRWVIVDGSAAYQSGASFKDGGRKSPTTLTQLMDAFAEVRKAYQDRWARASVVT